MACSPILPLLVTLLAPAPAEPAPPPADEAAPAAEASAEAEPAAEAGSEAAAPAPDPQVTDPFDAPPPTAVPPTTIAPIPPPPPRPIRWRLDVGLGIGATVVADRGYRAFAPNRSLVHVEPSAIFDFRLADGRFFLGGGVAYGFARRMGSAHEGALGTYLRLHEPRVVGRASVMTVEGIDLFARVGVGPSIVDLELDSTSSNYDYDSGTWQTATQRVVLPRVDGQAGLSLYVPKRWLPRKEASRVGAGLELSAGYAWRGKVEVQPALDRTDDPLRVIPTSFGALSLHGLSWGVGLFVRVM
jgi:hypothetical protein